jgi:hypothetical protein
VRHCPGLLRFEPSGALGPHRVNAARVRERGSAGQGYVTSNLSGGRQRPGAAFAKCGRGSEGHP